MAYVDSSFPHAVTTQGELCAVTGIVAGSYLSRPVWTWPINWSERPAVRFTYELNEVLLGFASPTFERLQSKTAHGFEVQMLLDGEAAIDDFKSFLDTLRGRLNGFWFPSPFAEVVIVAGNDATSFFTQNTDFVSSWSDEASTYLVFTKAGELRQYAKITAVALQSDGREKITVDSLAVPVDETWQCFKLLYVRLDEDTEQFDFISEQRCTIKLRLLELPEEYAAVETGQRPVFLYEFSIDPPSGTVFWRFTSLNENVVSSGATFISRPIDHAGVKRSIRPDGDSLSLTSVYESWNPLRQFFPFSIPRNLKVTLYRTTYAAPDTREVEFSGFVDSVEMKGKIIRARCSSFLSRLGRRFPRMMLQPRCNYFVFETPCGADKSKFGQNVVIQEIGGKVIRVSSGVNLPNRFTGAVDNYFALGFITTGTAEWYEVRTIEKSSAESGGFIYLQLSSPFSFAALLQTAKIYPGCDGSLTTCHNKFRNRRRWGGHAVSPTNLVIKAVEVQQVHGNKK